MNDTFISIRLAKRAALMILALATVLGAAPAQAQAVAISSTIMVERQTVVDGVTKSDWVSAETVVPGDTIKLSVDYANQEDAEVTNFVITNPVPAAVSVKAATPEQIVSIDGGKTFGPFAEQKFTAPDGTTITALPDQITHLRWTIASIPARSRGTVHFLGTVR